MIGRSISNMQISFILKDVTVQNSRRLSKKYGAKEQEPLP